MPTRNAPDAATVTAGAAARRDPRRSVSVVIPVFNERESLQPLHERTRAALEAAGVPFEVILVDDGSRDGSAQVIQALAAGDARTRGILLRRNFGKAAALAAGFDVARGDVIVTLDADLQDDPAEIPRFLDRLDEGVDLVSGWKQHRRDPFGKVVASRIFNFATRLLTGVSLHDINCGFKAYRREVVEDIRLYGELHRFIPVLASARGFSVAELPVVHHPRAHGRSKYNFERYARGLIDLVTVLFLMKFRTRPAHLFGGLGLVFIAAGAAITAYLAWLWLRGEGPIGTRPLFALGLFLMIVGLQSATFGLLAEMVTHLVQRNRDTYVVRTEVGRGLPERDRAGEAL